MEPTTESEPVKPTPADRFLAAVEHNLKGCDAFSVGACPGCADCNLDDASLPIVGASYRGYPLRTYDEGGDEVYLYVETMGPVGLVRASSFEEAYEVAIDAILDDADETDPDIWEAEHGPDSADPRLQEGYHFRPNGVPTVNGLRSSIASEDLNGSTLERVRVDPHDPTRGTVTLRGSGEVEVELDRGDLESARACADEGSFSRSDCDSCGSRLGGDRYPAHWLDAKLHHAEVCSDCLMYHANGDVPTDWR